MGSVHREDGEQGGMIDLFEILIRGALQVAPVAAGTVFISRGQYLYASGTAFVISFMWWLNAGTSSEYQSWAYAAVYACGASLGAMLGMWGSRRMT
jgi:hypothetical protein